MLWMFSVKMEEYLVQHFFIQCLLNGKSFTILRGAAVKMAVGVSFWKFFILFNFYFFIVAIQLWGVIYVVYFYMTVATM